MVNSGFRKLVKPWKVENWLCDNEQHHGRAKFDNRSDINFDMF